MIDLHTHSTESDGSYTVKELVDFAVQSDISVMALCDHDTTAGIETFVSYGKERNLTAIGSVELSAEWSLGNCHILGYGVNTQHAELQSMLQKTRDSRDHRNELIIEKLNQNNVDISLAEVEALAGGDVVGRPHMARIMVERGYVKSVQEAFNNYLAKGAAAYIDRFRLEPADAVALLTDAGAEVVLAHPNQTRLEHDDLAAFVKKLKDHGLKGVECYTPYTDETTCKRYESIARELSLIVTGGSDFHGASKPTHFLGYTKKNKPIPQSCADELLQRLAR